MEKCIWYLFQMKSNIYHLKTYLPIPKLTRPSWLIYIAEENNVKSHVIMFKKFFFLKKKSKFFESFLYAFKETNNKKKKKKWYHISFKYFSCSLSSLFKSLWIFTISISISLPLSLFSFFTFLQQNLIPNFLCRFCTHSPFLSSPLCHPQSEVFLLSVDDGRWLLSVLLILCFVVFRRVIRFAVQNG